MNNDIYQLLAHYRPCFVAVCYFELVYHNPENTEGETPLQMLLRHPDEFPPEEVIKIVQADLDAKIADGEPGNLRQARRESEHPTFRNYIKAKMGMM